MMYFFAFDPDGFVRRLALGIRLSSYIYICHMKKPPEFPFIPKSTSHLERGQFWAIPLTNGRFGAGCVVGRQLLNGKPRSRSFIAGVIEWCGPEIPTISILKNCRVLKYGFAHIKAITESGGSILGMASLQLDSLPFELETLEISTWGYAFANKLAEKYAASCG
jgi:hypothetical protein